MVKKLFNLFDDEVKEKISSSLKNSLYKREDFEFLLEEPAIQSHLNPVSINAIVKVVHLKNSVSKAYKSDLLGSWVQEFQSDVNSNFFG